MSIRDFIDYVAEYLDRTRSGEAFLIISDGQAVARLLPPEDLDPVVAGRPSGWRHPDRHLAPPRSPREVTTTGNLRKSIHRQTPAAYRYGVSEPGAAPFCDDEYPEAEQEADRQAIDAAWAEPGENIPFEVVLAEFGDTDLLAS